MKQLFSKLCMLIAMLWATISASAYDFEVDGIRYNLISATDLTVETTESQESINNENNILAIPDEVIYNNRNLKVIRIGANSFKGCSFKQASIGSNVEEIGEYAFANNELLESVEGNNIVVLGDGAFTNCSLLSNVKLGEKLSIIGGGAFDGCASLTNFLTSDSLRKIGEFGFCNSGLVTFRIGSETEIGQHGFYGCKNLTSFDFNGSVCSFPIGLFRDCFNLSELINFNVPATLPSYAFSHCNSLDIRHILDDTNLRNIGAYALEYCKFEGIIEIGSHINKIDTDAFAGFEGNVLINKSYRMLELGMNSFNHMQIYELNVGRDLSTWCIKFPPSLTKLSIGSSVSKISNIDLEKPSQIMVYPFQECGNLKEIYIDNSSSSLTISGGGRETKHESNSADYSDCYYYYYYSGLFSDCPLEKLYIGRPINFISEEMKSSQRSKWYWDYYYYYFAKPFSGIETLKEIEGNYNGFDYIPLSPSIECMSIGLNVDLIPDMSTCNLREINISTPIPPTAVGFNSKTYMDGILTVPAGSVENFKSTNIWENFWNIEANTSILAIDDLLYSIIQDSEVQLILCVDVNKEELAIPSEVEDNGKVYKVTSIGDNAFFNCVILNTISIPGSVMSLGNFIFNPYAPLKNVILEDSEYTLSIPKGSMALEDKNFVTTIDGHSVYYDLTIYDGYFNGLPIENLYIGRNLSSEDHFMLTEGGKFEDVANAKYYDVAIFEEPFSKLPNLENLTIGSNVRTLGSTVREIEEVGLILHTGSFEKCEAIKDIFVNASVPPSGAFFSETVYADASLIVPVNTKEIYREAEGWKQFKNIFDVNKPVLVEDIILNVNEVSLEIGDTFQLTAEVLPEDAADQTLIWESSNPKFVSVDENGLLTGLFEGEATITVRSADGNCEVTCLVSVIHAGAFNYGFSYTSNLAFPFLGLLYDENSGYYNPMGNYDFIDKFGVAMPYTEAIAVINTPSDKPSGVLDLGVGISMLDGGIYTVSNDPVIFEDNKFEPMPEKNYNYPFLSWGEKGVTRTIFMPGWGSEDAWEDKDYNAATEADWIPCKNGVQFTRLGTQNIVSRGDTYFQYPAVTGNVSVTVWASTNTGGTANPDNLLEVAVTPVIDGIPGETIVLSKENPVNKRYYKLDTITMDATGKNVMFRVGANNSQLNLMYVRIEGEAGQNSVDGVAVEAANAATYNLLGVKVDENYKGLVIKNGKKYIQK